MLTVYIDFKSPGAHLAVPPTLSLAAELGVDLTWLPYRVSQSPVPEIAPDEDKGQTHRRVRAAARRDTHLMYAEARDIEMRWPAQFPATDTALSALLCELPDSSAYLQAAFHAYWVEHADLDDEHVVAALLEASRNPVSQWQALDHTAAVETHQAQALEVGVVDVPAYVVADQVFIGREHLPWVRELLTR